MSKKDENKKKSQKSNTDLLSEIFNPTAKEETVSEAENIKEIITEWLEPKHIRRKTRLTKKQVVAISILQSLADTYHIKTLERFLLEFRTNKLSEDGKSSRELENILKARMPNIEEDNMHKLSKFLE